MKPILLLTCCLIMALGACSPYRAVTTKSLVDYNIAGENQHKPHLVLKKRDLHYMAPDSRNNVNLYEKGRNTAYESYSFLVEDNIVIPKGAKGSLLRIDPDGASLLIDFGEGIIIPFELTGDQNRAAQQIVVDKKVYRLKESRRTSVLCIDTRSSAD